MDKLNTHSVFQPHGVLGLPSKRVAITAALFIAVIALGLVSASTMEGYAIEQPTEDLSQAVFTTTRELPPEWQWQPKGVEYEHMYGGSASRPKLDWIRNGEASFQRGATRR